MFKVEPTDILLFYRFEIKKKLLFISQMVSKNIVNKHKTYIEKFEKFIKIF